MGSRKGNFVFVGGMHGIGKAAAQAAAASGSAILLLAGDAVVGEAVSADLRGDGPSEASFLAADLSAVAGMSAAADAILAWKPELHGMCHRAGSTGNKNRKSALREGWRFGALV